MRMRVMINTPINDLPAGEVVVRVFVEDTSRIDDAAAPVAESTTSVEELQSSIPVEITCREPTAEESFSVRVHVDVNGSGQVELGDLVSTAAHCAIDGDIQVPLSRVG